MPFGIEEIVVNNYFYLLITTTARAPRLVLEVLMLYTLPS